MNIAVILSGGTGSRVRMRIPKQYYEVEGHTMIGDCLRTFFAHDLIDAVWVVAEEGWHALIEKNAVQMNRAVKDRRSGAPRRGAQDVHQMFADTKLRGFSLPGERRSLSILNALRDIRDFTQDEDIVIIHDAARPFVSADQITRLIEACDQHDGALPALPMKDTVYLADKNKKRIEKMLDRPRVIAGQAPEAFCYGKYLAANEALLPDKINEINGSTEVALLAGMDIAIIEGEEANFKITSEADLKRYIDTYRQDMEEEIL